MKNESGLRPTGRAVLIRPYEPERLSSIIELPDTVKASTAIVEQRAVIIELGRTCWHDEPEPRAKIGDKVLVSKFTGHMAVGTRDGKQYRFVNDRDIFAIIEDEGE